VTLNQNSGVPEAQTVSLGSGADTIYSGYGSDAITAASHAASDAFVYAALNDSLNGGAHDTITGFLAGGAVNDAIDVSAINAHLNVEGALSGGAIAADSIGWVYSATEAFVYVNDTGSALSTSSGNLMEITLAGVHQGLSASNFKA
jgi:Ca2+-binding RTX toxin-like protein